LPHLKPGYSLRFAFLPAGEDPDSLIRTGGAAAMKKSLDAALPLSQMLWRAETEGKDFSTPERRAGLERALGEIVAAISDGKIADYYRRDFEQKVFDAFKRRPSQPRFEPRGRQPLPRPGIYGGGEKVSSAVKASLLARSGRHGARHLKEIEIAALILAEPEIVERHGELLADLPFIDRSLTACAGNS